MTTLLAQRKYRLAVRLSTGAAKTFGLWWVLAFAFAAIASVAYREIEGDYEEFAYYILFAIPLIMTASSWFHLYKTYPPALANGLTRKEILTAFAIYGVAGVLAASAFVQLGLVVIDFSSTFRGVEYHQGFYGLTLIESLVRPALYLALGAAAAAAMLRVGSRFISALVVACMIAAVLYRSVALSFVINLYDGSFEEDGIIVQTPLDFSLAPFDAALALLFVLTAWALLARAPMRPKPA
jgi:hypothetical protein